MSLILSQVQALIGVGSTTQNTTWVSKNGNDATGLVNRFDKPFLTKQAGIDATFTAGGGTVFTFPGTYAEDQVWKDGVNMYDMVGVVNQGVAFQGLIVSDGGVTINCKLDGFGVWDLNASDTSMFITTAGNNIYIKISELILNAAASGTIFYNGYLYFECDKTTTTTGGFLMFPAGATSTADIRGDLSGIDFSMTFATNIANIYGKLKLLSPSAGVVNMWGDAGGITPFGPAIINYFGKSTTLANGGTVHNMNMFRVTTTGINLKSVASTLLYTVPTGKTLVVLDCVVRCTAATAITAGATAGIGANGTQDDIFVSQIMTVLTGTTKLFRFPSSGTYVQVAAGSTVSIGVDIAATGTSQTAAVDLIGYLI